MVKFLNKVFCFAILVLPNKSDCSGQDLFVTDSDFLVRTITIAELLVVVPEAVQSKASNDDIADENRDTKTKSQHGKERSPENKAAVDDELPNKEPQACAERVLVACEDGKVWNKRQAGPNYSASFNSLVVD